MIDLVKNYSVLATQLQSSEIRELLKLTIKPEMISFAGGLPSPDLFPYAALKEVTAQVIDKYKKNAFQYGTTEGMPELKDEIVKMQAEDGVVVGHDNILITASSQQGLDLMARIFINPTDPVVVENPTYVGGLQAFSCCRPKFFPVETDEDGINTDKLEETFAKLRAAEQHYKFLYLVPDYQNPKGITISDEKRKKIVALSQEYEFLIFEDTPYRQLYFDKEPPASFYSRTHGDNVVSVFTFSKILTPGLRVGWILGDKRIINKLVVAKQPVDLCTSPFNQFIAAEFCRQGLLGEHIPKLRRAYGRKRDVMLGALTRCLGSVDGVEWTKPQGGLFLWLTLPEHLSADELLPKAIEKKVAYVVGSAFHPDGSGKNTMRLNFSFSSETEIEEGIKRLGDVIKTSLAGKVF
jgi:2-aminoadipate transaminase